MPDETLVNTISRIRLCPQMLPNIKRICMEQRIAISRWGFDNWDLCLSGIEATF